MKNLGLVLLAVVSVSGWGHVQPALIQASEADLSLTGGECFDCIPLTADPACKTGFKPACDKKTGFCMKYTFTGLSVRYCKVQATGGFKGCTSFDSQVCVRIRTCTTCDNTNPCTNCGAESTEDKTTKCTIVPYAPCGGT